MTRALAACLLLLAGCSSGEAPSPAPAGGPMPATPKTTETIYLAGGCFWGMEELLRKVPGVVGTEVGYTGGDLPDATYADVKKGTTGHAESVKVVYDPAVLSTDALLGWFFRMHDPTTPDRQGNDVGSQYRSAIFWFTAEQRAAAERAKEEAARAPRWKGRPITTEIREAGPWSRAEEYHQDYLQKDPGGYTCHWIRD